MTSLKNVSFTELKSIYDFLEIKKNNISDNTEHFEKEDFSKIINKKKFTWLELSNRLNDINEFKEYIND